MSGATEQNIIRFINAHNLVQKGDKLLIALSGGADSVFALHFFYKYKLKFGIELFAFHINHSLRGKESDGDELFCKSICKTLNIQFNSKKVDVKEFAKENKESIEEAARNIRYKELQKHAKKNGATKIVTAHNLNDNTETVLLNLFRGTGLRGVSGIPISRDDIIRPLISTSKNDIINYLNFNNIQFRIDSSNLESDFNRNFLRNEIIPKIKEKINNAIDLNLLKFSEIAKESNRIISKLAVDISEKYISETESGISIYNKIISENSEDVFATSVRYSIEKNFNITPTFSDIFQIKNLFNLQVGSKINLGEKLSAIREREFLLLFIKKKNKQNDILLTLNLNEEIEIDGKLLSAIEVDEVPKIFPKEKNIEYISGDKLTFPLTIRKWKNGDKFQPIGLKGTKNISDFLTESKVNSVSKKNQLLLTNNNNVVWVINKRIDQSVKINNATKRIIRLWVK